MHSTEEEDLCFSDFILSEDPDVAVFPFCALHHTDCFPGMLLPLQYPRSNTKATNWNHKWLPSSYTNGHVPFDRATEWQ